MEYVLVPRKATTSTADVWVGAFGDAATSDPRGHHSCLVTEGEVRQLERWTRVADGQAVWWAQATLRPRSRPQTVELRVDGVRCAEARVSTLPDQLGATPFRVLLASCFEPGWCRAGDLRKMLKRLGPDGQPHAKFFCGDQVYLDPILPRNLNWRRLDMGGRAAAIYRRTWTHPGLRALHAEGMNFFCPDDHDLWDNYTTTAGEQACERERVAKDFIRAFQCDSPLQSFAIGRLRFLIVDTRQRRNDPATESAQFIDEPILNEIVAWLHSGTGPAVLVLGQPIFGADGYRGKHGSDIPEYRRQFKCLAQALLDAPCSVLILSGDLHWGRVSRGAKRNGKHLIEVISSPLELGLLRSSVGWVRRWKRAIPSFGTDLGLDGCVVETERRSRVTVPHFATMDFRSDDAKGVEVEVRQWSGNHGPTPVPFSYCLA